MTYRSQHSDPRRVRTPRGPGPWILSLFAAGVVAACGGMVLSSSPSAAALTAAGDASGAAPSVDPGASGTASPAPSSSATPAPSTSGPFPYGLLIADRGSGRILAVDNAGHAFWKFPVAGSLPGNRPFAADDAFVAPDGQTIVANDEYHQVIYRIDIKTRKVVWQYGHFGVPGSGPGYLHNPDDAYPLANGDIVVADIMNCRVIEIAPSKQIVRTYGRNGTCRDNAPHTYGSPNGDTPLPDGGLLITEINGSRVVRLSATGKVIFDFHVPVAYPSDAQIDAQGNVIVVDYSNPGSVVAMSQTGKLLWRWGPVAGKWRMDHPSLGTPLPNGDIVINDDARDRVIVLDPQTRKVVWQYGHTDVPGTGPGYLSDPDGHEPIPANAAF